MEDNCFNADEDAILMDIARAFNIKSIKNRHELSAVWDSVTESFNKSTEKNYTKKQLQKRLTNISYKQKKQEEKNYSENGEEMQIDDHDTTTQSDLLQQQIKAEVAKEMAELKRGKVEETRLKKEEILLKVALANLKEAEKKTELIELELELKKRQLLNN